MLTPEQIAALGDALSQLTVPMEEYLIKDIARRIKGAGQCTSTAAYQVYRAQQLGLSQKQMREMLRRELKVSRKELRELLKQSAEVGYEFDIRHLSRDAAPFAENASLQQMVAAAVKLAKRDFTNITQTLGMIAPDGKAYPIQKAYQKACDYAFEQVFTGATDYNTAIRSACKNIADMGLRTIDYESGVHTGLEAAVRRNIMGGLGLMQEQISQYNHDQFGADGWEISAHAGSAPRP
ncbi:MAG: phage minor capsid protein [Angelakisella sp.]